MLGCAALVLAIAHDAGAQILPEQPISVAGGHIVLGAEVSATFAPEDPGFFNYTSYEFSALRNLRLSVSTEIRATDHVQVLAEVRLDQGRVLEDPPEYSFVTLIVFASRHDKADSAQPAKNP